MVRPPLFLPFLIATLALPGTLLGQEAPTVDRDRLEQFARAHVAIAEVRERAFEELARTHDPEGKERVRHAFDRQIEETLEAHRISAREFEEITFLVSTDPELQASFQEILTELEQGPGR